MMPKDTQKEFNIIKENMKKNDKFIGDILAPFEQALGMKFNKFKKPENPKFEEPKRKGSLKRKLKEATRKQDKLNKMDPEKAKKVHWQNAIEKAQGTKIKDDPKLIKKAIKRKQSEKVRHRKKWAERTERLEHSKEMREKKKKARIQSARSKKKKSAK